MHPNCGRCNAIIPDDKPHICKDVAKRYERRARQAAKVNELIQDALPGVMYNDQREALSERIVEALAKMGVNENN